MNVEEYKRRRVIEYATEHPEKRQIDIARDLGLSRSTVQRALSNWTKPNKSTKFINYVKSTDCDIKDDICEATGLSPDFVRKLAIANGYTLRTKAQVRRDQLKDYITVHPEGFTVKELAEEFGYTTTYIRRLLNRFEDEGFRCMHLLIQTRSRKIK